MVGSVRRPVVAGMFYDSDAGRLKDQLSSFFKNVRAPSQSIGVVSPHAGYVYSGQTAAWAIASLKTAKTYIMLGPNHNTVGERFSVMSSGSWETPFGSVKINTNIAKHLMEKASFLADDVTAHAMEHSIEVQLPFLQHRIKEFDFVPISIMNIDYSDDFLQYSEKLGRAIASLVKSKKIGIVASSDFSHYLPKQQADEKDGKALEKIMKLDVAGLMKTLESIDASVCGYGPIAVLMSAAKALGLKARLLNKSTSGDVTGDERSVVAYYAIGFG
jgi:AmmeMemoRadiSam system protein B